MPAVAIVDRLDVGDGALEPSLAGVAAAAAPVADGGDLRHALHFEQRAPQWVLRWQVHDRVLRRRQHLADLAHPHLPGSVAPEIVHPEEAALVEVGAQRRGIGGFEDRRADVRGEQERTLEQERIGRPEDEVIGVARGLSADPHLAELAEAHGEIEVGAGIVGAPSGAARLAPLARVHQAAEVEAAIEAVGGGQARREATAPASAPHRRFLRGDRGGHHQQQHGGPAQAEHVSASSHRRLHSCRARSRSGKTRRSTTDPRPHAPTSRRCRCCASSAPSRAPGRR